MRDPQALADYLRRRQPLTSVVSYPARGPWGNNQYPGNCSGYMLIDLCATYRPRSVLDPMEGGGTSRPQAAKAAATAGGKPAAKAPASITDMDDDIPF